MGLDRSHIFTEQSNPESRNLDQLSVEAAVDLFNHEDRHAVEAVAQAKNAIVQAVHMVANCFQAGGRLIYFGAGTSGRLGVLDAAECPPTFCSDPAMVQGVIAGGDRALRQSVENVEDDPKAAETQVDLLQMNSSDIAFGIAAGGTTPFVHGALARAKASGAKTIFLACTARQHIHAHADLFICLNTGPEILTGSTRLKAGTATKLVLNTITTLAMVQIGKTFGNLMVDVDALKNSKLIDRSVRIINQLTGLDREKSHALLQSAGGRVKRALVMHHKACDAAAADALLARNHGQVRSLIA